jgi:cytochrome c-type biogenesis protein CcmH
MQRILLVILVYLITSQIVAINCYSVEPDEFLQNPKKELRARNISKNIRCLVCQNQSIDESSAPLAKDLRILIRRKIEQGNSDEKIYNYLTERYGDFILLNPPFKISTLFLWFLPFVFLAIGIFVIFLHDNKSRKLDYNK